MSKKIQTKKWDLVPLDGFPITMMDKGFVGLEECTDYGLDKQNRRSKKNKQPKKRKPTENKVKDKGVEVPQKKIKLSNGFIVETCKKVTPSKANDVQENNEQAKQRTKKVKVAQVKANKVKKPKLGENIAKVTNLTKEDMLSWAEFKLPEEIVRALMEQGFKNPTKIQQLVLPAAIHGRRDILGAAETGSGKTLAFGLPILTGIMKLKEKAEQKGLDVYDIPFKKTSVKKRKDVENKKEKINGKDRRNNHKNNEKKVESENVKESSEDGYSSGDGNESLSGGDVDEENNDSDFIEEIEVPLRKSKESEEDDLSDEDYVHLSDMLESDDLESDENDEDEVSDGEDYDENDDDEDDEQNNDVSDDEENSGIDEVDIANGGRGCVKVIEDVSLPEQVMMKTGKPLYALILTPTRELAIQISRHLIAAAKYTGIKIATVVGGMAAVKQERVLSSGPEVVVATPGRLWQLLTEGQSHLMQIPSVKFLAIDETDRMIERGHFEELQPLLERLNSEETHKNSRQNFVFSATLTMAHDLPSHMKGKKVTKRGKVLNRKIDKMTPQQKIKRLVDMIGMSDPKVVDITTQNLGAADTLTECRITCSLDQKDVFLYYILKRHPGRTIVFCNSISSVKRLAQILALVKCNPLPLHASMPQRQRLKNLERFRDDVHGVLVSTDVAARGLDIPDVDHVIHYQVPRTAENYIHRSGRTARASKEGLTILMMEPAEAYTYSKLCRTLNKTSELPTFPVPSYQISPIRDIINLARELDSLTTKKKRLTHEQSWRDRAEKEMDLIIDDDDVPEFKSDPSIDKALKTKRKQLESILARPLFPKGFSYKYPTLNDPNALQVTSDEKALEVMKKAIQSGELKREKRKGKNAPLLKLEKLFRNK
ncbi:ATP-dependent RNA helicase DDX24 [Danaus plexippus]|nr:ATP-dependent RNA helicase DDX24 [Danaus plexippus]